jgi:hypothetical protein
MTELYILQNIKRTAQANGGKPAAKNKIRIRDGYQTLRLVWSLLGLLE